MTYFVDTDNHGAKTIYERVVGHQAPVAIVRKCDLPFGHQGLLWATLVDALVGT